MKTLATTVLAACAWLAAAHAHADGFTPLQMSALNPAQICSEDTDVHGIRITILHGVNQDLNGIDVGPIGINVVEGRMIGIQAGGLVNSTARGAIGIQAAMGVNLSDYAIGIQVAGVGNRATTAHGLQIGAVFNNADSCNGAQVGLANRSVNLNGLQIGFMGFVERDLNGIQLTASPFLAAADSVCSVGGVLRGWQIGAACESEHVIGLQTGGMVNYASTCSGAQIGLVNVAATVRGVQIGVVNYCQEITGVQIGLVNVIADSDVPFLPVINMNF